jgi:hypothetical protein
MVPDEEILELVHDNRDDLEKAVKSLVAAANRGGGEDNITAVAFRISADAPATKLEDTVAMPAISSDEEEPEEETQEQVQEPPVQAAALPAADARRVRLVLIGIFLLLVVAGLVIWGLLR